MTPGPVGVGVIGAGVISTQYLENLTRFPDVAVRFVADLDTARAHDQAAKFGVARSGPVGDLLADDGIEIVLNLTLPRAHAEVARAVLAAGKHVWSEKPFALDRASGQDLLDTAHAAGLRVATAPDTFLGAGLQSARRLLESGRIGTPLTALTLFQAPGPEAWHPNPDFLFQEGGGPLFDMGPYYLTALAQFFGPVARVSAVTSTSRATRMIGSGPRAGESFDVTVPTHVAALYEFEGGGTAQSVFSFDSALERTLFEVTGAGGTVEVPDPNRFAGDLTVHGATKRPSKVRAAGSTFSRGVGVIELARAIRAGVPERASGELAFHVLDVMQSTIEAGETGTRVDVASTFAPSPPLPDDWDPSRATL